MRLDFTESFSNAYRDLAPGDTSAVDSMLDRLEVEHRRAHMRNVISVGLNQNLFATPRFSGATGVFRITLVHSKSGDTGQITCVTVARADRQPNR